MSTADLWTLCLQGRLDYLESADPTLQDEEQVPPEFDDPHHHQALAFAHYIDAYEVFLKGADVYPEQERVIEERYGKGTIYCSVQPVK